MRTSIVIAVVLALAVAGWIASGQFTPDTNAPTAAVSQSESKQTEKLSSVRVRELVARPLVNEVRITGETRASRRVVLRAETDGQVEEIFVNRGDQVKTNQVLGRLKIAERSARLDEYEARLEQRQIEFDAAQQLSERGYRSKTGLAAAAAELDAARAVVRQMQIDIERTSLRAPFDGIVDEGHIEIGDYVKIGDTIGTLVDLDPILVLGYITEREVGELEIGAPGTVTLVGDRTVEGKVTFISPVADPATRTYRFELTVENADLTIRDGITARIAIPGQKAMAHFISPAILTLNDEGIVGIRTVDDDNIVRFLPVKILSDTPDGMWLGGLPESVRAIVVGQEYVIEGETVIPVLADNVAAGRRKAGDPS